MAKCQRQADLPLVGNVTAAEREDAAVTLPRLRSSACADKIPLRRAHQLRPPAL